ncbi:hypothetical protein [Salinibacter ruber]|uniref:Major capsid protein n=1 Tax=Salinibacter ruber TaxID=146919 RepID=A0A9X2TKE0_9BACT|nr:hypothetical protein [Salinibacter ruber]MCS3661800.1 hypothetical protein [Salinibacter ruber]MCS3711539.1 hypothetical protein [Salinibacter ruber]
MAQLSAGTLEEQADLLTNPSLQRSMIRTIKDRGARELMAQLPFKSFVGKSYDFTIEDEIGTGNSAQDPYGDTIPSGGGKNQRVSVGVTMMIRNAVTPKIDVVGKSDFFQQREDDFEKEAKKLGRDFFQQFLNGLQDDTGTHESYNLKGLEYWFKKHDVNSQTFYATDDATLTGNAENLSYTHIDELLSRQKGEPFQVMYMNRETSIAFRGLLNNMPGNVAGMMMEDTFGRQMLHYDGTPIVVNDSVAMDKPFAEATVSGTTVTVTDPGFLGFSELVVGESITVGGSSTTVASVTDTHTVEVSDGTALSDGSGQSGVVEQQNVIYAGRMDPTDGIAAVYHENRGVPADAGEHYGAIAGFDAQDQGLLESAPRYQSRLDFYGQTVVHDPEAQARVLGFSI